MSIDTLQFGSLTSPSNVASPVVSVSQLMTGEQVLLYLASDCSGSSVGSATANGAGQAAITVSPPLAEGIYQFYAYYLGKCASASLAYELDLTVPVVSGVSDDPTPALSKTFTWSCGETCTYRWLVDQLPATSPSGGYGGTNSYSNSTDTGTFYLHVQAMDAAGNESSVVHASFILDNTAPATPSALTLVTPASSPGNVVAPEIQISGVEVGATVTLYSDSGCVSGIASAVASGTSVNIVSPALSSDGTYDFWARATDAVGNVGSCSISSLSYTLDRVAPTVTGLSDDPVPAQSKTWSWGCDEICTYLYMIDTNPATNPAGGYSATNTATQGWGSGTYYLHVQAMDQAGNVSAVVHVSAILDNVPPAVPTLSYQTPATSPSNATGTPTFLVGNLTPGDSVAIHSSSCAGTIVGSGVAGGGTLSITLSIGQPSNTSVNYYATTTDGVGNSSCSSFLNYSYDTTAPSSIFMVDDGVSAPTVTQSPVILFSTSYDASAFSYEARIVRVSDLVAMSGWMAISSGGTLSGLSLVAGVKYRAEVRATDAAGNTSMATIGDGFYYDPTVPATAPGAPTLGVTPNYLDRTPTLTFSPASDPDSGIAYYEAQVYDSPANTVKVPWAKLTGGSGTAFRFSSMLTNMATYYVKVRAVNGAGLAGPASGASATWTPGCSGTTLLTSSNTAYSNGDGHYCLVVPGGITSIAVKAWGGGGGGSVANGGAGGFAAGIVSVTPGEILLVTVGGGGERGDVTSGGSPGYGGGGAGMAKAPGSGYKWGSGGGGYSAIFRSATPLLIAGAGGGGEGDIGTALQAGLGGGTVGGNDSFSTGGKGGTQVAGGAGGGSCGLPGSSLKGGDAGRVFGSSWGGGGGGGGGYYGGGGGCLGDGQSTSGGGGSSYYNPGSVSSFFTSLGTNTTPYNDADPDRTSGTSLTNTGYGGLGIADGGPGRIFISW